METSMSKYFNFYKNIWVYHKEKTENDIKKGVELNHISQEEYELIIQTPRKI